MKAALPSEILEVDIEAEYQGQVYERTVHVAVEESKLAFFEGTSVVTERDVGEVITLEVECRLPDDLRLTEVSELTLTQASDRTSPWSGTVVGEVLSIQAEDPERQVLVLDVGPGTISVPVDEATEDRIEEISLQDGDVVRVDCGRMDVIGRRD